IEGMEAALRQVGQREALLQEANQNIEQMLQGGVGRAAGERVGPWKLGALIGRGGMGEVYEARHVDTDKPAALKLLNAEAAADPDRMARFLREAEAMKQLESPHICRVLDARDNSTGLPYIAMELLQGYDLASLLRRQRRLSAPQVMELVGQVAKGLETARKAGIVHRDLKPQNLYYAENAKLWKVLDFGISKLGETSGTLTKGLAVGTPGYMAPEQATGGAIDHRADVFGLAVIAYRALTGRPAFWGDAQPNIMFDIVYRQPLRPSEFASMDEDVDRLLALALAKRPDDRFNSAEELAAMLGLAVKGKLPDALRDQADVHVARYPWGRRIVD